MSKAKSTPVPNPESDRKAVCKNRIIISSLRRLYQVLKRLKSIIM